MCTLCTKTSLSTLSPLQGQHRQTLTESDSVVPSSSLPVVSPTSSHSVGSVELAYKPDARTVGQRLHKFAHTEWTVSDGALSPSVDIICQGDVLPPPPVGSVELACKPDVRTVAQRPHKFAHAEWTVSGGALSPSVGVICQGDVLPPGGGGRHLTWGKEIKFSRAGDQEIRIKSVVKPDQTHFRQLARNTFVENCLNTNLFGHKLTNEGNKAHPQIAESKLVNRATNPWSRANIGRDREERRQLGLSMMSASQQTEQDGRGSDDEDGGRHPIEMLREQCLGQSGTCSHYLCTNTANPHTVHAVCDECKDERWDRVLRFWAIRGRTSLYWTML